MEDNLKFQVILQIEVADEDAILSGSITHNLPKYNALVDVKFEIVNVNTNII